jgi:hypothetical protein
LQGVPLALLAKSVFITTIWGCFYVVHLIFDVVLKEIGEIYRLINQSPDFEGADPL